MGSIFSDTVYWIGILSGVPLVLLCIGGVVASIVGALFQINDQAFSFSIKMLVLVFVTGFGAHLMWGKFCAWVVTLLWLL
jgi:type III secretory pathway component EscS